MPLPSPRALRRGAFYKRAPFLFSLRLLHLFVVLSRLKAKGRAGKHVELEQPQMRMEYVRYMGGVDRADQQNESHYHDHKSYTNHWRRVFDAKIMQMLTNTFLVFRMWVRHLLSEVEARMSAEPSLDEWVDLDQAKAELTRLSKKERAVWDEELSEILMKRCDVGTVRKGGKAPRSQHPKPSKTGWGSVELKSGRLCMNPACQTRTKKGCTCPEFCTFGVDKGVLMCLKCFKNKESHKAAADARWGGVDILPCRTEMAWTEKS